MKKLYRVDVKFFYYITADDPWDAMSHAREVANKINMLECAWAREARPHEPSVDGWTRESLVYEHEQAFIEMLDELNAEAGP